MVMSSKQRLSLSRRNSDINCYMPTPEEIQQACQKIRHDWSPRMRRMRDPALGQRFHADDRVYEAPKNR